MLLTSSLNIGGAETVISTITKHLDMSRFNVVVAHLKERGGVGDFLYKKGFKIVAVSTKNTYFRKYFSFLSLSKLVKQFHIDVIHTHTTYSLIDAALCKLFNPHLGLIHTFHYGNYPHYPIKYRILEYSFMRFYKYLVAVGENQKKAICKTYRISEKRVLTIRNGIDVESNFNSWETKESKTNNKTIIGTVSTHIEQKGLIYLLDAVRILKKQGLRFKMIIVGDGPLRKQLEEKCTDLDLSDLVQFTGYIENANKSIMRDFDIFVQSSLWEAMSIVVLEAMAGSKACVVTAVGENPYIIKHNCNGFLVKPRDSKELAVCLAELICNAEKRKFFGIRARELILSHFTARYMVESYQRIYSDS